MFRIALFIEAKKLFSSRIPLFTLLASLLVPFLGAFFMLVLGDPLIAERLGIVSLKAELMGIVDLSTYLNFLAQAIAIGGLIIFGFVFTWIFGREYVEQTIDDLLALPVSRSVIVLAKFTIAFLWCFCLALAVLIIGIFLGKLLALPGGDIIKKIGLDFLLVASFTILLSTPLAFLACWGKGYLLPLGFMIFTLVLAQVITAIGYGAYFPWSVGAVFTGLAGEAALPHFSFFSVLFTGLLALGGTIFWWRTVDHG
mgnify:CR=1 FL=1